MKYICVVYIGMYVCVYFSAVSKIQNLIQLINQINLLTETFYHKEYQWNFYVRSEAFTMNKHTEILLSDRPYHGWCIN